MREKSGGVGAGVRWNAKIYEKYKRGRGGLVRTSKQRMDLSAEAESTTASLMKGINLMISPECALVAVAIVVASSAEKSPISPETLPR